MLQFTDLLLQTMAQCGPPHLSEIHWNNQLPLINAYVFHRG